jgi:predicted NAD/FAD-dependent oxidoreductase
MAATDEHVVPVAAALVARLFGDQFAKPAWTEVRRWEFSQPERIVLFDTANPPGQRILVAGDATLAGRAENAFETGIMAAERLLGLSE